MLVDALRGSSLLSSPIPSKFAFSPSKPLLFERAGDRGESSELFEAWRELREADLRPFIVEVPATAGSDGE